MDAIKEAFAKIKEDISFLKTEIFSIKNQLNHINQKNFQLKETQSSQFPTQKQQFLIETPQQTNTPTNKQTENNTQEGPKEQILNFSTGNDGVPTNKQTNTPTNKQTKNNQEKQGILLNSQTDFRKANEILNSLDEIKREIRLKFKKLTPQEMMVFSNLYLLQDTLSEVTYRTLALKLRLSESSIRDYINKLIIKGIPINKTKQNNKTITLSISQDLKKIATLATIIQLRDI
ncbi:MAG: hypothetical protein WC548_03405 [Candidatus Pacearchaeota archaeon]